MPDQTPGRASHNSCSYSSVTGNSVPSQAVFIFQRSSQHNSEKMHKSVSVLEGGSIRLQMFNFICRSPINLQSLRANAALCSVSSKPQPSESVLKMSRHTCWTMQLREEFVEMKRGQESSPLLLSHLLGSAP